jgi:hypothetical protein
LIGVVPVFWVGVAFEVVGAATIGGDTTAFVLFPLLIVLLLVLGELLSFEPNIADRGLE